jgi:phage terminase Nu1 subunit (DNA packaging protein)
MTTETTSDTDDKSVTTRVVRGSIMSKVQLADTLGYSQDKIDGFINAGAPVIRVGEKAKKIAWQISVRAFVEFMISQAVKKAVGDGKGSKATGRLSFEEAKRKDKEVQSSIRELDLMKRQGELVDVEDVRPVLREVFANVRSRLLSVPSQITGLTVMQQRDLQDAINDALADLSGENVKDMEFGPATEQPKH